MEVDQLRCKVKYSGSARKMRSTQNMVGTDLGTRTPQFKLSFSDR